MMPDLMWSAFMCNHYIIYQIAHIEEYFYWELFKQFTRELSATRQRKVLMPRMSLEDYLKFSIHNTVTVAPML